MNEKDFSGFFPYYQETIKQLAESLSLHQKHLMQDIGKQLRISQSFADLMPTMDYSRLLPDYSFITKSISSQLIEAMDIPQLRFATDIGNILKTSQLFREQLMENQAAFNKIHSRLIADLKPILDASESMQVFYDSIRLTELESLSSLVEFPALSQLSHTLLSSIQTPQLDLGEGFLSEISALLASVASSKTLQIDDEIISEFVARFADHANEIKKGRITREGIAQITRDVLLLLTIILSWLSLQSSYDTGRTLEETQQVTIHLSEQMEKQALSSQALEENTVELQTQLETVNQSMDLTNQYLETIVDLGERLIPYAELSGETSNKAIILVVKRPSLIRTQPSRNGAIITRVYPNQLVEQLKRENNWVYVEYFDFSEGIPRTGWIYRWNLILFKD